MSSFLLRVSASFERLCSDQVNFSELNLFKFKKWKKYPYIFIHTHILSTLVVFNVVYRLLSLLNRNMSQSEHGASLAFSERLEKLSLNVH